MAFLKATFAEPKYQAPLRALFIVLTLGVVGLAGRNFFHSSKPVLGASDRENTDSAINRYIDPATMRSNIEVPALAAVAPKGAGQTGGTGGPLPSDTTQNRQHIVAAGETLSGIADQYGMSSGSLVLANKDLQDTELIHEGQVILIPDQPATPEELAAEMASRQKKLTSKNKATTTSRSLSSSKSSGAKADGSYILPLHYRYISQGFSGSHPGEDMVGSLGTPIHATKSGCIISATGGWNGGYGNLIIEDLGGGITARYAHLNAFADGISGGVCVDQGDTIGYLGTTGRSTGPHLHFELRSGGVAFNPGM